MTDFWGIIGGVYAPFFKNLIKEDNNEYFKIFIYQRFAVSQSSVVEKI